MSDKSEERVVESSSTNWLILRLIGFIQIQCSLKSAATAFNWTLFNLSNISSSVEDGFKSFSRKCKSLQLLLYLRTVFAMRIFTDRANSVRQYKLLYFNIFEEIFLYQSFCEDFKKIGKERRSRLYHRFLQRNAFSYWEKPAVVEIHPREQWQRYYNLSQDWFFHQLSSIADCSNKNDSTYKEE